MAYDIFEIDYDMDSLTKAEKSIFYYLVKNKSHFDDLTANSVAKDCYVTTTSVNRLCKKMGLTGFSDLKAIVKYENTHRLSALNDDNEDFNLDMFYSFNVLENEITDFVENLDFTKPIYIYGAGSSQISASYLNRFLLKMGYLPFLVTDRYILNEIMSGQVILISNSGETASCLNLAMGVYNKDIKLFVITRTKSSLAKSANYIISHPFNFEYVNSFGHEQQIHIVKIINYLVQYITKVNDVKHKENQE